ncbi:hypothetical protein ACWOF5_00910 [Carnobacterium divergens]
MTNELKKAENFKTALAKINDAYTPMITDQLEGNGLQMSDYKKQCVLNAISAINTTVQNAGLEIGNIDQSNLTQILVNVASLELNAAATPRECYFITRNVKQGKGDQQKTVKQIELGIEGDGNDAILARFGRNVKKVYPFWLVREQDTFIYPRYKGIEFTPPEWEPTGEGRVERIVYPIEMTDGSVEFHITERNDVKKNLLAHMYNNLMWDKDKIKKKQQIKEKASTMTLNQMLDDEPLLTLGQVSPAWKDPQSSESMIIRKMRNNIVKKIPKDFSNAFVAMTYQEQTDEELKAVRREVTEEANKEILDFPSDDSITKTVIEEHSNVPINEFVIEDKKEIVEENVTDASIEGDESTEQAALDLDMKPPHIAKSEELPSWLK